MLGDPQNEQFGYFLAGINKENEKSLKLLVHTFVPAKNRSDLKYQSTGGVCPSPEFQMRIYSICKKEGYHLIDVHSHPFDSSTAVRFSGIDDRYEFGDGHEGVFGFTAMWNPDMYHASIVFGQNSLDARIYKSDIGRAVPIDAVKVLRDIVPTSSRGNKYHKKPPHDIKISESITQPVEIPPKKKDSGIGLGGNSFNEHNELYSRQILAFGKAGQESLSRTIVAVVGAGGLGSIVVEILARLGIGEIICVDDDVIEISNISRVLGSYYNDADTSNKKVTILEKHVNAINSNVRFTPVVDTILSPKALGTLKRADFIISGTDTFSSRVVLNQFAVQYLIPYIDLGFGLEPDDQGLRLVSAGGKVKTYVPGNWCFHCLGEINQRELQLELMRNEDKERQILRGYITGIDIPDPSVIFLDMMVASLGICELLNLLVPFKKRKVYIYYDMLSTKLWNIDVKQNHECLICSPEAEILGRGDYLSLEDIRDSAEIDIPEIY